jgi:CDP-diacylglycerol--glycerol-3-phosphate 3-phosphatidyltransferase
VENNKSNVITFPNILSISRIILSPIIFFTNDNKFVLFFVLIIIGFTDVLDGYIARKYKKQTIIGSWLDSVSDFVFYILLVIYTIIFEFDMIIRIKYYVIIISGLKLLTVIISIFKYKKLGFLHTFGNKFTGIMLFIGFCIYILLENRIFIYIGLIISIISSMEEIIITIIENKYEENIKGIWEIKKLKK